MIEFLEAIRDFTETGGQVLLVIGLLIFVMWLLILERAMYLMIWHKQAKKEAVSMWTARNDRASWIAQQVRQKTISQLTMRLNGSIPMLGLMGTVTGMIEVFDVMAIAGSGNARSMASGVSKATIPTMAGMVGALSGVFASTWLNRMVKSERTHLEDALTIQR
jgi:biopolymer transport protein ExbB